MSKAQGVILFLFLVIAASSPARQNIVIKSHVCESKGGKSLFIDLDRGNDIFTSPKTYKRISKKDFPKFLKQTGIDVNVKVKGDTCYVAHVNSFSKQVDNKLWETASESMLRKCEELMEGETGYGNITKFKKYLPRTYFFKTSEGGLGVFRISADENSKECISFEYKLFARDSKEESNDIKLNVKNEANREIIEKLVSNAAKALRPAENMRVSFTAKSQRKNTESVYLDDYVFTFAGDRSRLEHEQYKYDSEGSTKELLEKTVSAYDGIGYRELNYNNKGEELYGMESLKDFNKAQFKYVYYGRLFNFIDYKKLLEDYVFELVAYPGPEIEELKPRVAVIKCGRLGGKAGIKFYIDISRDFNIVKAEVFLPDSKGIISKRIVQDIKLNQNENQRWFPFKIKTYRVCEKDSNIEWETTREFKNIKFELDIKVDEKDFMLKAPENPIHADTRAS